MKRKIIAWLLLAAAVPLWMLGELGTLGAIQPVNRPWDDYVTFQPMFLVVWAASVICVAISFRLLDRP